MTCNGYATSTSRSTAMRPPTPRGRDHETRHVEVFDAGTHFRDTEWAPFIAAVIRVHRRRLERDTATGLWNTASETSYHVSNAVFSARASSAAIRAHWGIENRHHYPRDVTMGEDACRVPQEPRHPCSNPQFRRQHHAREQRHQHDRRALSKCHRRARQIDQLSH